MKRTISRCYTQNIKALGFVVKEKIFHGFLFKPMADNDAPGAWPVWTLGARFIKWASSRCYTQNTRTHGFVVSEKKMILCFSI